MKKILVAVDGSEKANKAVKKAAEVAEDLKLDVTVIHVFNDSESTQIPINKFNEVASYLSAESLQKLKKEHKNNLEDERQKIVDREAKFFEEQGMEVEKVLLYGDPADKVCEYAEENDFDLIVVADKGRGKVEKFLLGSISDKIVRHSKVSVMVVK